MSEPVENQESEREIPAEMKVAWEKTLHVIEKLIRPQYFQSFILTIRLIKAREDCLVLGFPDRFYRDWVYDHYSGLIQEKFDEITGARYKLEFTVELRAAAPGSEAARARTTPLADLHHANSQAAVAAHLATVPPTQGRTGFGQSLSHSSSAANSTGQGAQNAKTLNKNPLPPSSMFNSKYGFETFVVGGSNQFAHAAAFTVAEAPGRHYNPLFIYGGVGLGKTHLMNAIGLKIQEKFPSLRVHYTTFEKFTNQMIEGVRYQRMEEFRDRYRKSCDVLIIDDIQFISGKERTQEEFFHTFNALYEHQKQIVLSSDRHPKEIQGLEDRLRSRFEMGLTVDIQAPEMETRVAIVFKKAEMDNIQINHDVAFYLAKIFRSNIRELEGALLKLSAFASLTGSEINMELAKKVLREEPEAPGDLNQDPEEILRHVSRHFQITLTDLRSNRKNRQLAVPRQLAMFLCRKYSHLSLPDIGTLFGGKNHTTVLHAVRRIEKLQVTDSLIRDNLTKLEAGLRQSYSASH